MEYGCPTGHGEKVNFYHNGCELKHKCRSRFDFDFERMSRQITVSNLLPVLLISHWEHAFILIVAGCSRVLPPPPTITGAPQLLLNEQPSVACGLEVFGQRSLKIGKNVSSAFTSCFSSSGCSGTHPVMVRPVQARVKI